MPLPHRRLEQIVASLGLDQDPAVLIAAGEIEVDGFIVTNPGARVPADARVRRRQPVQLRGEAKLRAALAEFAVDVRGRTALDVGAAAGGFTRCLLAFGAARVYAVDAGHGQLLGSLRQDPRVVNLEATNIAVLNRGLVPEPIEVVTIDVSYLSLTKAVDQLGGVDIAPRADLIGLVKPMFELRRSTAPLDEPSLAAALEAARRGVARAGWTVLASAPSPVAGARGARELLLHARWSPGTKPG